MSEVENDESLLMTTEKEWKIPPPSNPLLIDLVLDKLVAIVNIKDLPSCRLVCKLWNLKTIPRFRREFEVCVENGRCRDGQNESLKRFLIIMKTRMDQPYAKFRMNLSTTNRTYKYDFFCKWSSGHLNLKNWTVVQVPYWAMGAGGHDLSRGELIHLMTYFRALCVRTTLVLRSVDSWPVGVETTTTDLPSNAYIQMSEKPSSSIEWKCIQWREFFQMIEGTGSKHWSLH